MKEHDWEYIKLLLDIVRHTRDYGKELGNLHEDAMTELRNINNGDEPVVVDEGDAGAGDGGEQPAKPVKSGVRRI